MIKFILLVLLPTIVMADISIMKKGDKLYITDDGVNCIALDMEGPVAPGSVPENWMNHAEAARLYNWPAGTDEERANCGSYDPDKVPQITVAKNSTYPTRPLKDPGGITIGRVAVGNPCETERIRPYSSRSIKWGYHYTTNEKGIRGLAVCATE